MKIWIWKGIQNITGYKWRVHYNINELYLYFSSEYKISQPDENDRQSPIAIKHALLKENCKRWFAAHRYHKPVFPQDSFEKSNISLTKSLCNINRTLSLIAIDSLHYFHFAEGLGIDILKKKDKTAAIILDVAVSFTVNIFLHMLFFLHLSCSHMCFFIN